MSRETLSAAEARRLVLAAQGLSGRRPEMPCARDVRKLSQKLGVFQIDSVNVLVRAHYMPLFSRLGAYDRSILDHESYRGKRRSLFEYWGHEASLLPVSLYPCFRWRMADAEKGEGIYSGIARFARENRPFVEEVFRQVESRGPLSASELKEGGKGEGNWWGWAPGKTALEYLFWAGRITTATRRGAGFERVYDLPERALPSSVISAPAPTREEAQRTLLKIAISSLAVATEKDLRDYYRLPTGDTKARIAEMVEEGSLASVQVKGWGTPAFMGPAARLSRLKAPCTLLAPFDPLVWERNRAERLFDFRHRIEIYVPEHKRTFGYYVLPVLLGDRIVARVDLKADRAGRALLVRSAHIENHAALADVGEPLAEALSDMAEWLDLDCVRVAEKGSLSDVLSACVGRFRAV